MWIELEKMFMSGKLISHEYVYDEFFTESSKPDFISKWIKNRKQYFYSVSDSQIELVQNILKKFPKLIDPEKEKNQADPWIIALAKEKMEELSLFKGRTKIIVVSQEKITSSIKIPAACREFGVQHMNLEEFYKDNNWKFSISTS